MKYRNLRNHIHSISERDVEIEAQDLIPGFDNYNSERFQIFQLKLTFMEIFKLCKQLTKEKKPHMLTFYGIGHGATNE